MTSATQSYLKISSVGLFLLGLITWAIGCSGPATVETTPVVDLGTVAVTIDFPDCTQHNDIDIVVGCSAHSTVFEALQRAQTEGSLEFEHSSNLVGESASVFVRSIGGVGGGNDKFWTYFVNDELAKESCGTCTIKPGDRIRWVFGEPPAELFPN